MPLQDVPRIIMVKNVKCIELTLADVITKKFFKIEPLTQTPSEALYKQDNMIQ